MNYQDQEEIWDRCSKHSRHYKVDCLLNAVYLHEKGWRS